jgi:hypothetical protein
MPLTASLAVITPPMELEAGTINPADNTYTGNGSKRD